jgi:hypothetical protein
MGMKRVLLVILMLAVLTGLAFGQEEEKKPTAAVSFVLLGGIIAPIGINAEFFLGPVGLAAEVRGIFMGYGGNLIGSVEPGANVRVYFSGLDSSMYLMGGVSYLTVFAIGEGSASMANVGVLKPKAAVGYNALFGKSNRTRFAIELGAVYMWPVVEGDAVDASEWFPILPHFQLMFGRAF